MPNKIVVNTDEFSKYLYQFLLHSKIGHSYELVVRHGFVYVHGHIHREGKIKVTPLATEYLQVWPYQRFARLAVIVGAVEPQDAVIDLDTLRVSVIL